MERSLPCLQDFPAYISSQASRSARRTALGFEGTTTTYEELEYEVARYETALCRMDGHRGDVVAVVGHPRPECLLVFLACCRTGAIFLGLNPKYTEVELVRVCEDAKPSVLFAMLGTNDYEEAKKVQGLLARVPSIRNVVLREPLNEVAGVSLGGLLGPADGCVADGHRPDSSLPCALVYTSGSTGEPKGALLPQAGLLRSAALTWQYWYGGMTTIRTIVQHPINHVGWLTCECLSPLVAGAALLFRERFDPAETLRFIEAERVTLWFTFPAMATLVTRAPAFSSVDLSALERIAFGSSPSLPLLKALRTRTAAIFATSYGLTEACGGAVTATVAADGPEVVADSIGQVVDGLEVKIVNDNGRVVADGEPGELLIRDDTVFLGYLNRTSETAAVLDEEGWLSTGDVVTRDDAGVLRLVGRKRDMFKSGGYNVYPAEVERALCSHPDVMVAAVVDVPDPVWGQVGAAYLVLADGVELDRDSIDAFLRSLLANFKIPKYFLAQPVLPRLANGKIDKLTLRATAASILADGALAAREAS